MDKFIKKLNGIGQTYVCDSFHFERDKSFIYKVNGVNLSSAMDNKNQQIKVINWFDDFWLFASLHFSKIDQIDTNWVKVKKSDYKDYLIKNFISINNDYFSIFFSLSIFQGLIHDQLKTQLFRAEWDNYTDFSNEHPQPHWHVYPHKYSIQMHKDFEDFYNFTESDGDFKKICENETATKKTIINLNKFHFAMDARWSENQSDLNRITSTEILTNWFSGLLNHIKKELSYMKKRNYK